MIYSREYKRYDPLNLLRWLGSTGIHGDIKIIPQKPHSRTYQTASDMERYNSLSWVTQRVGHLALSWRWPQQSITWLSSACFKGWTPGCPRGFRFSSSSYHWQGPAQIAIPLSTCALPGTTAHPSTWTQTSLSLHLVPEVQFWPCNLALQPAASIFRFFWTWALSVTSPPPTFLSDSSSALSGLLRHSIT